MLIDLRIKCLLTLRLFPRGQHYNSIQFNLFSIFKDILFPTLHSHKVKVQMKYFNYTILYISNT